MFKAFTGALSLALALLVFNWILPEVLSILVEVVTKSLQIFNEILDQIQLNMPQ